MGRWAGPKYPEGPPPNYDPENPHADPVALLEHREYEVRRKEVGVAKAQILRERLRICYIKEGVNHIQNCKQLAEQYLDSIKNVGIHRQNSGMYERRGAQSETE
ncbi:hypothetical protein WJX77_004117 [Trebouxia sp. C0004]